ncbi:amidohydrolase family protein [Allomuricauda sp. NBRC 101325]|uniref:amidohydrolase family protein n=1 Tax=Allomuricauda sp. NBRC 101325 TaxID=1113758 RepID=UPI0024A48281|nr:amidohydrolase family protein [Muricauda sp. NBRC 101325]GLU44748.1 bifunctional TolB-family protein/amidohydrolase [Muricauda sp. NBRC 101325]
MKRNQTLLVMALFMGFSQLFAQEADSTKKATKELPLEPERTIAYSTKEGTWLSLDVSPDGTTIIFDMMGDVYTIPITGGKATQITEGMAYDVHPRFSPDGKSIVYISDKSGSDNIWTMELDSKETNQITKDSDQNYFSADWSPDGDYIVGARGRRNIKLHMYHKDGGGGAQLIDKPDNLKAIDPIFAPDGKLIYFSQRRGGWNYNAQFPQYQLGTYNTEDGELDVITSRYGSAFTPTLSPDGKWLVYGSRFETETGLVLRNLENGDEKWLAYPIQRDEQESIAPLGVLPAMAFTPDSKNLVASYGGKIYSINIASNSATEIPFEVDVKLELGPQLSFKYPIDDAKEAFVTQIRDAVPSPDGSKLAFTALNRLYVMDLPDGTPKRLTKNDFVEAQPAWSPDGENIVFATWETDGGYLYKVNASGRGRITKLTEEAAVYSNPAWSYKSDRIVFTKGTAQVYRDAIGPITRGSQDDLAWVPAEGGKVTLIDKSKGRSMPHFTKVDDRIYLSKEKTLLSIRWDGTDEKEHLTLSGITTFGSSILDVHDAEGGHDLLPSAEAGPEAEDKSSSPSEMKISPDGTTVLAQINNDIYTVTLPRYGKTPKISVASADKAAFPAKKLTVLGGEFPTWAGNSKDVHWSLGASHFIYNLPAAQAYADSVATAKKEAAKLKEEKKDDEHDEEEKDKKEDKDEGYIAKELKVKVSFTKDMPEGTILLKGARIITMKNDEVIENGDILIENNRIKAVGATGTLEVPKGTIEIDATGKTITPGFVDTHGHLRPNWGIHKNQIWIYSANLAYGVTTTRDPQTSTTDVLTYADMVKAGMMHGPRVYSTGPGVGYWAYKLKSLEHTKDVLKQYSEYYDTKTIKMYLVGNRQMRQWVIMAAKELKLMPTTEGGLDFKLNMTQLLDGYPGHEHSLPIYPIYKDVVQSIAESKMAVTPTLLVSYGGPWAEEFYYSSENPYHDAKLQYFTPYKELAGKSRRRSAWFMPEEHVFPKHAEFMKDLVEAGGLAGVGSHGQLQGLGFHWELWSVASGGMKNMDALKVATIIGAEDIGLDGDIGSIEAGKLADILIMEKNPLEDLRNTNTLTHVIKNGKVYDANTLDEVAPVKKEAESFHWQTKRPEGVPGMKK